MKNNFILFILLVVSTALFSKDKENLVSLRANGIYTFDVPYYGPGLSFQHRLKNNFTYGFNTDLLFANTGNFWNIEPRIDYYTNEIFNGFHVGTNIGFMSKTYTDIYTSKTSFVQSCQLGLTAGYTLPLSESIKLDAMLGGGYLLAVIDGQKSGFSLKPTLSLGFQF